MKKYALVGAAACLLSMGLFGCNNTAEGVSKDAAQDGQKAASAANDAADATKKAAADAADATKNAAANAADAAKKAGDATVEGAKKAADATGEAAKQAGDAAANAAKDTGKAVTAATEVTPKVKLAILADKDLNNPSNLIDIKTENGVVHVTGHVQNNAEKKKAGMIADKALKDLSATDKLSNELTVTSH